MGGGSIVTVASVVAVTGWEKLNAYSASKGGVLSFSRALAIECGSKNIRVNCICPGVIETPMTTEDAGLLQADRAAHRTPGSAGGYRPYRRVPVFGLVVLHNGFDSHGRWRLQCSLKARDCPILLSDIVADNVRWVPR